ncbi:MAG: pilus assembly PilX N-terminal domain-containing protein, partial [Clostridium sp.]
NKKEGSSLVMLLMISMLISILSAVSISTMLSTSKGNVVVKNNQDLFYSAESGVELGIALIKSDITYLDSKNNTAIKGKIDEKSKTLISSPTNSVFSVDIEIDSVVNTKAKIKSIAYGYDENGNKDLNNKRVVEKTISRKPSKDLWAKALLGNSIIASDKININAATINMETTQIASGLGKPILDKIGDIKEATIVDDKYNSPIFKGSGNARSLPNIRKQSVVKFDRFGGNISTNTLFNNAVALNDDGTTIANNGIGKIVSKENSLGEMGTYNVILVNADKLIIEPQAFGLNEDKTIIICSGDIEVRLSRTMHNSIEITKAANITSSTLFGKNVTMTGGAAVTISRSPLIGQPSEQLSENQLQKIDKVLANYIENWGTSESLGGIDGNDEWQVVDSETVYE